MPFDPDAFLAEKQTEVPVGGSAKAFDPDAFLASSESIIESQPVSMTETALRGAAQGATASFGDELTSGVDALVETIREKAGGSSSLASGKGLKDKYEAALSQNRGLNLIAEQANPGTALVGQLGGALPSAIATGGTSLAGQAAAATGLGALTSVGQSEGKTASEAAKEAATSGALAGGLSLLLGGGIKLLGKGLSKLFESPAQAGKLSYQIEKSLTDPKVAQQIGQEIYDVGDNFAVLSQESRKQIGQNLDSIASRTNARINPNSVIEDVVSKLDDYNPGRNALAQGAKQDLKDAVLEISQDLFKKADADGKVSFSDLHKLKQTLSQTVYEQGLYKDSSYVDKLAKQMYKGLSSTLKKADATGEYENLSKVYQTLSSSDPEAFTVNALKYLQDPWDVNSRGRLTKLLGDLQTMGPDLKNTYLPKLAKFIDEDFQNAAIKAELLKKVGGKNGALALKGVPLPNPSAIASDIGAGLSALKPALNAVSSVAEKAGSLSPIQGPIARPVAGGLVTVGTSQGSNRR